jgi:predicted enzyme related to lactoylglutathione lyase
VGNDGVVPEPKTYPHGVPSWIDTVTHDLDDTRRFYAGLFDWTFTDVGPAPGSYQIATIGGHDVAAIASAESDDEAATWRTYVAVVDADTTAKAVEAAGGTITVAPVDAGPGGRLAACVDPRGGQFRLWQARLRLGAQIVNAPGTWNFSDLLTSDPTGAAAFYAPLFGWEIDDVGFATVIRRPGYGEHLASTVDPGIRERQSAIAAPPGFEDAVAWLADAPDGQPDFWRVTFAIADLDASAATAETLGATILATDVTEWTKTATVRDPQGAQFVLSQFTPPTG